MAGVCSSEPASRFIRGLLGLFYGSGSDISFPLVSLCKRATPQFTITRNGLRLNNATNRFMQTITITNSTTQALSGPFALALDGLSSTAALYQPAGVTACALPAGSPFVLLNPGAIWNPGQSVMVNLEFLNPTNAGITYMPRVLAGGPNR